MLLAEGSGVQQQAKAQRTFAAEASDEAVAKHGLALHRQRGHIAEQVWEMIERERRLEVHGQRVRRK